MTLLYNEQGNEVLLVKYLDKREDAAHGFRNNRTGRFPMRGPPMPRASASIMVRTQISTGSGYGIS